jgi:hypothetical protein
VAFISSFSRSIIATGAWESLFVQHPKEVKGTILPAATKYFSLWPSRKNKEAWFTEGLIIVKLFCRVVQHKGGNPSIAGDDVGEHKGPPFYREGENEERDGVIASKRPAVIDVGVDRAYSLFQFGPIGLTRPSKQQRPQEAVMTG